MIDERNSAWHRRSQGRGRPPRRYRGAAQDITTRGAPIRANRVLAVASKMFSLSLLPMAGEIAPWRNAAQGNPCKGVERNREEGQERFFCEAEIAALTTPSQAYGTTSASNCLRFIMLTGCRPGEAMRATWDEFADARLLGQAERPYKAEKAPSGPAEPGRDGIHRADQAPRTPKASSSCSPANQRARRLSKFEPAGTR